MVGPRYQKLILRFKRPRVPAKRARNGRPSVLHVLPPPRPGHSPRLTGGWRGSGGTRRVHRTGMDQSGLRRGHRQAFIATRRAGFRHRHLHCVYTAGRQEHETSGDETIIKRSAATGRRTLRRALQRTSVQQDLVLSLALSLSLSLSPPLSFSLSFAFSLFSSLVKRCHGNASSHDAATPAAFFGTVTASAIAVVLALWARVVSAGGFGCCNDAAVAARLGSCRGGLDRTEVAAAGGPLVTACRRLGTGRAAVGRRRHVGVTLRCQHGRLAAAHCR